MSVGGRSRLGRGPVRARFVRRENRFVARVAWDDGDEALAYVPNTARLEDLLRAHATVLVEPAADPARRTRWTLTRAWDGTWVALDATAVNALVADALASGRALPGWPPATAVRREVTLGRHRFDLGVDLADGRTGVVEVKSLTSAHDGVAPLSATPSARGAAHLVALAQMAHAGTPVAVALVVQRADVEVVDLEAPAAGSWIDAMRRARAAGVTVAAFACEVTEDRLRLGPSLAVRGGTAGTTR